MHWFLKVVFCPFRWTWNNFMTLAWSWIGFYTIMYFIGLSWWCWAPLELLGRKLCWGRSFRFNAISCANIFCVIELLLMVFYRIPWKLLFGESHHLYNFFLPFQINASSTEDGLNFYDCGHRFEHSQLLLVLLHSLPHASVDLQNRALQVIFWCVVISSAHARESVHKKIVSFSMQT